MLKSCFSSYRLGSGRWNRSIRKKLISYNSKLMNFNCNRVEVLLFKIHKFVQKQASLIKLNYLIKNLIILDLKVVVNNN